MDPDATLKKFYKSIANGELEEADEAAESLSTWLENKGYPPCGYDRYNLLKVFREYRYYRKYRKEVNNDQKN